jgi:hypothetical protein
MGPTGTYLSRHRFHLPSLDACTLGLHYTDASIHQLTYLRPCRDMVAFWSALAIIARCLLSQKPSESTLSKKGGTSVPAHRGAQRRVLQNLPDLMNECV